MHIGFRDFCSRNPMRGVHAQCFESLGDPRWADDINTNTARSFEGGSKSKTFETRIYQTELPGIGSRANTPLVRVNEPPSLMYRKPTRTRFTSPINLFE